jgi:hypothetical protein
MRRIVMFETIELPYKNRVYSIFRLESTYSLSVGREKDPKENYSLEMSHFFQPRELSAPYILDMSRSFSTPSDALKVVIDEYIRPFDQMEAGDFTIEPNPNFKIHP